MEGQETLCTRKPAEVMKILEHPLQRTLNPISKASSSERSFPLLCTWRTWAEMSLIGLLQETHQIDFVSAMVSFDWLNETVFLLILVDLLRSISFDLVEITERDIMIIENGLKEDVDTEL